MPSAGVETPLDAQTSVGHISRVPSSFPLSTLEIINRLGSTLRLPSPPWPSMTAVLFRTPRSRDCGQDTGPLRSLTYKLRLVVFLLVVFAFTVDDVVVVHGGLLDIDGPLALDYRGTEKQVLAFHFLENLWSFYKGIFLNTCGGSPSRPSQSSTGLSVISIFQDMARPLMRTSEDGKGRAAHRA